jgi:protein ImuA
MSPLPSQRLEQLRAEVRAIECAGAERDHGVLPFGIDEIDRRLAGGGLAIAACHEVAAAQPSLGDDAAACLFAAALAARRSMAEGEGAEAGQVLWALHRRDLFAPGLAQAGLTPDRLIYADCGRDEEVLAVMEEALRYGCLAAVVGEVGRIGMAATRRLQLAAEEGGTTALILKRWRRSGEDPLAAPSSAVTRWRVACAPSAPLLVPGIGRARWRLTLARQRGGEPFETLVEAPDAEARLALAPAAEHRAAAEKRAA